MRIKHPTTSSDRPKTKNRRHKNLTGRIGLRALIAVAFFMGLGVAFVHGDVKVGAAACPAATSDLGVDSVTINVATTATYTVWTRMKAPDTSHNSVNLEVDGNTCFNVGGGTFTATSWAAGSGNWIKYQNGNTSSAITLTNLSAGNHTFKYVGTQAGVEIDRIILRSDNCTPTGVGTNCETGDSTNPVVNLTAPTSGQSVTGTLKFIATATDASGIQQVSFSVNGTTVGTVTSSPYEYDWNSAGIANGTYPVIAQATDNAGNTMSTTPINITVNNVVPCTGNPSVPTGLHVTATSPNSVTLGWNASTAATGCTMQGYKIFRNGTQVTTATATTFNDTGLTPSTSYSYTIAAVDTSSHTSAQSTPAVSGSTAADTTQPSAPTGLTTTLITSSAVGLTWTASTDNTGVKDYIIYRNGTQVGISTTTSFTDSTAQQSTTYSYTVRARDAANNLSDPSAAKSVTTLAGTGANKGDLNGSGKVDLVDLSILLSHWSQSGVAITEGDVNASGKVDLVDLSILLSNWGKNV